MLQRASFLLLIAVWLAAGSSVSDAQSAPLGCVGPVVVTPAGAVCGERRAVDGNTVDSFLGIPYAASTAGANRFRPPVPAAAWNGQWDATAFGPVCPQTGPYVKGLEQSEACLTVNVWVPEGTGRAATPVPAPGALPLAPGEPALHPLRPVLVFLYGGGFVHGGTAQRLYPGGPALYDGARLAASQGIVVVTLNYRIGVLGFLAGAPGVTANLGLLDQQLAFRWVQRSISAFGGDPERVTLAGESAGAMSVGLQLLSMPSSQGSFRSVILESDPFGLPYRTEEQARLSADLFLLRTGCKLTTDTLACLQRLPLSTILKAQDHSWQGDALASQGLPAFLPWAPVIDGRLVVRQPLAAALERGIAMPVLLGTNGSEGTLFFAGDKAIGVLGYDVLAKLIVSVGRTGDLARHYPPSWFGDNTDAVVQAASDGLFVCPTRAVARAARANAYLYSFTHVSSFNLWSDVASCQDRSCHGDELPFVFGTAGGAMAFTPAERKLSDTMMAAWGAFVRDGTPAASGGPAWPAYQASGQLMRFDTPAALGPPAPAACGFWAGGR